MKNKITKIEKKLNIKKGKPPTFQELPNGSYAMRSDELAEQRDLATVLFSDSSGSNVPQSLKTYTLKEIEKFPNYKVVSYREWQEIINELDAIEI